MGKQGQQRDFEPSAKPGRVSDQDARREREAAALRENLKRRKEQQRARELRENEKKN